jgi:hypothetical protein
VSNENLKLPQKINLVHPFLLGFKKLSKREKKLFCTEGTGPTSTFFHVKFSRCGFQAEFKWNVLAAFLLTKFKIERKDDLPYWSL